jgi:tyrosyl-DNA phosphodiesterase-1
MCQAVWRSPLLPIMSLAQAERAPSNDNMAFPSLGSGPRFKLDLLAYLRSYGQAKTGPLTKQLQGYDFTAICAALVASTPSKVNLRGSDPDTEPLWGWPGLRRVLRSMPAKPASNVRPHVVVQVSSIASLGQSDKWLAGTLLNTLATRSSKDTSPAAEAKPKFSIVFPNADEIRRSLDGYNSGSSIHMKTQSTAQAKQVEYMRPMLCHWAGDKGGDSETQVTTPIREAGRRRAAPHIKTYIRFSDSTMTSIDWALVTSANLSTQAWGSGESASGEVRTCSYEIGVLVWPGLYEDGDDRRVEMVPVFKQDQSPAADEHTDKIIVGFRMPYDLPLVPYSKQEMPWCATAPCSERDWMGRTWPGFGVS